MAKPLVTVSQLLSFFSRGCSTCGETHEHAHGPMVFTSKCRPSSPVRIIMGEIGLLVLCHQCDKTVVEIIPEGYGAPKVRGLTSQELSKSEDRNG